MTDEIKIINADDADNIDPNLPPAGHARDEELSRRKDALDAAAEQIEQEHEIFSFDPKSFKADLEILQHLNELAVENAQPGRAYFWCYEGQSARFVTIAQRLGWVVVQGSDPECSVLKDARGYRKIGDTILMWVPQKKYKQLEAMREYKNLLQQEGVKGALREMGEKYRSKGFVIHEDASDVNVGRKGKNLMDIMENKSRQTGARNTAMKGVDNMLRSGTVPGIPTPGRGR